MVSVIVVVSLLASRGLGGTKQGPLVGSLEVLLKLQIQIFIIFQVWSTAIPGT